MSYHTLPCRVIEGMTRGEYELLRSEIAAEQMWLCVYCSEKLTAAGDQWSKLRATLEHILSKSRGGTDDRENLAVACYRCNSSKSDKTLLVFLSQKRWSSDHFTIGLDGVRL